MLTPRLLNQALPLEQFFAGPERDVRRENVLAADEVLTAVTRTAAEALGLDDRGSVTPGKRADLLVVEGNPLEDLACLERVRGVMKAGRWVTACA